MPETPKSKVKIRDFPGLATELDSLDLAPGTAVRQTNVTSQIQGLLKVRPGMQRAEFED